MKEEIFVRVAYKRLRNNEFRNLFNEVVGSVESRDPEALGIEFVFSTMLATKALLQTMHVAYGPHPQTTVLSENRDGREKLVRSLVSQVRAMDRASSVYTIPQMDVVALFVERYLAPVVGMNSTEKTDVLTEMFVALNLDAAVKAALTLLNLMTYFDQLKLINLGYVQTVVTRKDSKSTRVVVDSTDVRDIAQVALSDLLYGIKMGQKEHPLVDYNPLITVLNETFTFYSSMLKTRATILRNAKNVARAKKTATDQDTNLNPAAI